MTYAFILWRRNVTLHADLHATSVYIRVWPFVVLCNIGLSANIPSLFINIFVYWFACLLIYLLYTYLFIDLYLIKYIYILIWKFVRNSIRLYFSFYTTCLILFFKSICLLIIATVCLLLCMYIYVFHVSMRYIPIYL